MGEFWLGLPYYLLIFLDLYATFHSDQLPKGQNTPSVFAGPISRHNFSNTKYVQEICWHGIKAGSLLCGIDFLDIQSIHFPVKIYNSSNIIIVCRIFYSFQNVLCLPTLAEKLEKSRISKLSREISNGSSPSPRKHCILGWNYDLIVSFELQADLLHMWMLNINGAQGENQEGQMMGFIQSLHNFNGAYSYNCVFMKIISD